MGKQPSANSGATGDNGRGDEKPVDDNSGTLVIDPNTVQPASGAASGTGKRRRGRPSNADRAASGAAPAKPARVKKEASAPVLDIGTLTLITSFVGGVIAARNAKLALDDQEAEEIARAAANVGQHYNVPVSPVQQAWIGLGMTVGSIYAGKILAIRMSRAEPEKPSASPNGFSPSAGGVRPQMN